MLLLGGYIIPSAQCRTIHCTLDLWPIVLQGPLAVHQNPFRKFIEGSIAQLAQHFSFLTLYAVTQIRRLSATADLTLSNFKSAA